MKSKKRLLRKSRLYAIIDKKVCAHKSLLNVVNKIKKAGVSIIQFRDKISDKEIVFKDTQMMRNLLLNSKSIFVINDYVDVAKILDLDGIHLGQDDISIETARKILGKDTIIGVSCHNLKQAVRAQNNGADYISIGPIFATSLKPQAKPIGLGIIKKVRSKIKIPFFVIGGINETNLNKVLFAGARKIAICRAICQADNIIGTIKNFRKKLGN
jgi:thiamine-phosphate pyrophosphorylase